MVLRISKNHIQPIHFTVLRKQKEPIKEPTLNVVQLSILSSNSIHRLFEMIKENPNPKVRTLEHKIVSSLLYCNIERQKKLPLLLYL
jgi:hypothetical protein